MSDQGTTAASSPVPTESGPQSSGPSIGSRIMNGLGAVGNYIGNMNSSTALGVANLGYGIFRDLMTWRREDTAYRRAVHDMDKAGLNTFNAGQVSPAGSSQSSAMQTYALYRQLEQRDRELDIQAKEAEARIEAIKQGSLGDILGTQQAAPLFSILNKYLLGNLEGWTDGLVNGIINKLFSRKQSSNSNSSSAGSTANPPKGKTLEPGTPPLADASQGNSNSASKEHSRDNAVNAILKSDRLSDEDKIDLLYEHYFG